MRLACTILLAALGLAWPAAGMERGEILFHLGGCQSCHSQEGAPPLSGGAPLATPLGTFHPPNITPDPKTGIGSWSEDDFLRAMGEGVAPDGSPYYPAFPFASYARMTQDDLRALWAYLRNDVAPAEHPSPPHELMFPFSVRTALWAWRWLFFDPTPIEPDPARGASWNEGAYLVRGPGHCAECHSPRTFWGFGVPDPGQELGGNPGDLITGRAPAITPDPEDGIGKWSPEDLDTFLSLGMTPEGDFVGGEMAKVVENATGPIPAQVRAAIGSFLLTPR